MEERGDGTKEMETGQVSPEEAVAVFGGGPQSMHWGSISLYSHITLHETLTVQWQNAANAAKLDRVQWAHLSLEQRIPDLGGTFLESGLCLAALFIALEDHWPTCVSAIADCRL